jgi:photosystem II stability/assembly factor-like uncharacterized protein
MHPPRRHHLAAAAATLCAVATLGAPAASAATAATVLDTPGATAPAPAFPPALGGALGWRLIGPFRGGRALAVSGVASQPETFYFGAVGGGLWRSDDAGNTWRPIFDGPPSGSIGAFAVAPSNPDTLYVGTGEADMRSDISYGDGMYRSTDGGRTFQPIGLADSRQIGRILVDPRDPAVILVAALGHGFGPNPERGVFRSADGGKSWQKVLYRDADTGAIDLAASPDEPDTVYAALWNVRRPAWSTYAPLGGPGGGIFKSTDGGKTWRELSGHGLPAGPFGRIGLAVAGPPQGAAPHGSRRVYALIDDPRAPGLYRSEDGGASWQRVGTDERITSRPWYFGEITVDPHDADRVWVANVSLYGSTDGGRTFRAVKGAPGGDDYHHLWIDPGDSRRMILGGDQGAVVSVDGAATWSTWFNQPTAQIYHVATDDGFPYVVYGSQQDSGTVATVSRSDSGQITYRDWFSTGSGESGYILPDPADPDTVFGGDTGGQLYRFSRRTSQVQNISPTLGPGGPGGPAGGYRYPWTAALAIAPLPPHALYQGSQFVHRSTDRGMSWTVISPDLTVPGAGNAGGAGDGGGDGSPNRRESGARQAPTPRAPPAAPASLAAGAARAADGAGVIYTLAPSPAAAGQIWAGTDNGLIYLTRDDGKSWQEVTPPGLPAWSMVSLIEASRFDAGTAYAAIDRHQMDDLRPYALRTRDFGRTWTPIAAGLPAGAYVHVVREDPARRGLLYAGTETGAFVSFDDGALWHSLQLNLPAASVRDLAIHGDDLIAATHGRSFWVLDGLALLRQLTPAALAAPAHLFTPAPALRKRRSETRETPLPPEVPAGANPPAGALIDFWLAAEPAGDVTLEVLDERGETLWSAASNTPRETVEEGAAYPVAWRLPGAPLAKTAGLHRFVWNLRYPAPPVLHADASADAIYGQDTPLDPEGPFVLPGTYQLRLTAGGQSYSAAVEVVADPRAPQAAGALAAQLALARRVDAALAASRQAVLDARAVAAALGSQGARGHDDKDLAAAIARLRKAVLRLAGGEPDGDDGNGDDGNAAAGPGTPPAEQQPSLSDVHDGLIALAIAVGAGDAAPTAQETGAFTAYRDQLDRALAAWGRLRNVDLPALNRRLTAAGFAAVEPPPEPPAAHS